MNLLKTKRFFSFNLEHLKLKLNFYQARKKVIKELQREKRTHKIPKSDKKRRVKLSKGKK